MKASLSKDTPWSSGFRQSTVGLASMMLVMLDGNGQRMSWQIPDKDSGTATMKMFIR